MNVSEKDWKLFRKKLPEWQEAYMENLVEEYIDILKQEGLASDKYWMLEKRIKDDKRNPGVLLRDVRRSNYYFHLTALVGWKVITFDDLDEFSEETRETISRMVG